MTFLKIKVKYNNETLEKRIENYIKNNFEVAYEIASFVPVYLLGGAIRDLIMDNVPKDLDFIVLGMEYSKDILEVLNKYKIDFNYNHFGGYRINYNGVHVDLWASNDLFSAVQYNVDGLFFYLNDNNLISFSFDDFVKNGLKLINPDNNIEKGREKKLLQFEKDYKNLK